jgi:hypothetical protein
MLHLQGRNDTKFVFNWYYDAYKTQIVFCLFSKFNMAEKIQFELKFLVILPGLRMRCCTCSLQQRNVTKFVFNR